MVDGSHRAGYMQVCTWTGSPFHGNGEPLYLFVLTQFLTEGYGEVAELNRVTLFLELLEKGKPWVSSMPASCRSRRSSRTAPSCSTWMTRPASSSIPAAISIRC